MIKSVEKYACEAFGVTPDQLRAKTRKRQIVECRLFIMWYRYEVEKIRPPKRIASEYNLDRAMCTRQYQPVLEHPYWQHH